MSISANPVSTKAELWRGTYEYVIRDLMTIVIIF